MNPGMLYFWAWCLQQVHIVQLALSKPDLKLGGAFSHLFCETDVRRLDAVFVLVDIMSFVLWVPSNFAEEDQVFKKENVTK